jgi:hypothetical protein
MSVRLTVEHSYSKKMLESGDNQIKKKTPKTKPHIHALFRDATVLCFRLHHITIVFVPTCDQLRKLYYEKKISTHTIAPIAA